MQADAAVQQSQFAGKGPAQPLPLSQEGQRRFFVGLSWGAEEQDDLGIHVPHLKDENGHYDIFYFFKLPFHLFRIVTLSVIRLLFPKLYRRGVTDWKKGVADPGRYDLDLCCYVFDDDMNLVTVIGPADDHYADASKKVYHSGDDIHGSAGTGDNEQAFVETRGLPPQYAHFYFVVETDGRYTLGETPQVRIRLADSLTNKNALACGIAPPKDMEAHGYVFCHVFRDGDGWAFRPVAEYQPFSADWVRVLQNISHRA